MIDVVTALTVFVVILPVELPDKTFVATLVLSTRYSAVPVWIGVVTAFFVQCLVAVAAGDLLGRLPQPLVLGAAAALFALGCVVLLRSARSADEEKAEAVREFAARVTGSATWVRAMGASFLVLFVAEWGDLSQLFTAGLAARSGDPVSVFVGSWLALPTIAGAAVVLGRELLQRLRLAVIRRIGAGVCGVLAVVTAWEALR